MDLRKFGHNIIDNLFKYSLHISSILLVALSVIDISNLNDSKVTCWGLKEFPIGKLIYYVVVVATIVFGIFSIQNSQTVSKLERENSENSAKINDLESALNDSITQMNDLFNSYILLIVKNLDFTHTERISVYKVFEEKFLLIGRASTNPNLKKNGRNNYPINEGFIGKGWAEGEFFIDDLPDPTQRNRDPYYTKVNSICPIPKETIKNMNMASRTFFIYRINGYDNQPKAILVIESLREKAFAKEEVIDKLSGIKQPLVMFVEKNNGIRINNQNNLGL
jgi:hypothetical protein